MIKICSGPVKLIGLLLATISIGKGSDGPSNVFENEPNALPYADHVGRFCNWWDIGSVRLTETTSLPIRINFQSNQDNVANSDLGWNWWMPLMESTMIKESESLAVVRMIGGRKLHLFKDSANPHNFASGDGKWTGTLDGASFMLVDEQTNWKFNYNNGRILSMQLPGGAKFDWKYDARNKPISIKNRAGEEIFHINCGPDGKPSSFKYRDPSNKDVEAAIEYSDILIAGGRIKAPVLKRICSDNGVDLLFGYEAEQGNFSLNRFNPAANQLIDRFSWNAEGIIVAANDFQYQVTPVPDKRPKIKRQSRSGPEESYWFDAETGISYAVENGEEVIRKYIFSPGPNYAKIREVQRVKAGQKQLEQLFYSKSGELLRHTIKGNRELKDYCYFSKENFSLKQTDLKSGLEVVLAYKNGSLESITKNISGKKELLKIGDNSIITKN